MNKMEQPQATVANEAIPEKHKTMRKKVHVEEFWAFHDDNLNTVYRLPHKK